MPERLVWMLSRAWMVALGVGLVWAVRDLVREPLGAGNASWTIAALLGALAAYALRRKPEAILAATATAFAIYLAEAVLLAAAPSDESARCPNRSDYNRRNCLLAARAGAPFDTRSRLDVLRSMRADGADAQPTVNPRTLVMESSTRGRDGLVPLGGVSLTRTLYCNENGEYVVFDSDEHGMRNPTGLYRTGLDVVLVGDSFVHGGCVESGATLGAVLRRSFPKTLTLAADGNGPMIELALVREYGAPLRPHSVVWAWFEGNDPGNLRSERELELLNRYLEPTFRQGLIDRQVPIDSLVRDHIRRGEERAAKDLERPRPVLAFRDRAGPSFVRLMGLRSAIDSALHPKQAVALDTRLLTRVLARAEQDVAAWGGQLHVAYLPQWERYGNWRYRNSDRDALLRVLEALGIPLIDLVPVFDRAERPLAYFPFEGPGHYVPAGYRVVGEQISASLQAFTDAGRAPYSGRADSPTEGKTGAR